MPAAEQSAPEACGAVRRRLPLLLPIVALAVLALVVHGLFREEFLAAVAWAQDRRDSAWVYGAVYGAWALAGLPTTPLLLGAGYLYGAWLGAAVALAASGAAATVAFGLVRTLRRGPCCAYTPERLRATYPELELLGRLMDDRPLRALFLVRMLYIPKPVLNYGLPLLGAPFGPYLAATVASDLVYAGPFAYVGSTVQEFEEALTGSTEQPWLHVVFVLVLLLTAVAMTAFLRRLHREMMAEPPNDSGAKTCSSGMDEACEKV